MLKCWSVLPLAGSRGQRSNSIEMLGCGGCGGCCYYYNRQWLNIAATSTNAVQLRPCIVKSATVTVRQRR